MKCKLFLFLFLIIFSVGIISAEQSVKTVEYPLSYISQTIANQDYTKAITINSPDGIAEILSLEIYIKGDFQATTQIEGKVESSNCNPSSWTTPNMNAPNYELVFDCTNLVKQSGFTSGTKEFKIKMNKVAQNIKAKIKITYYNKPESKMEVLGTDYFAGDNGTIFLQLLDDNKQAIENSSCRINAYYPNKNLFLSNILMNYLDDGLYYYDTTIPSALGVYMLSGTCAIPNNAWTDDFIDSSKLEDYSNVSLISRKVTLMSNATGELTCSDGAVNLWHLNENNGTVASDSCGAINGTTVGNPNWVAGKLNNCIQSISSSQYLKFGNIAEFERTDNFSIAFWVKTVDTGKYLFAKRDGSPNYRGYYATITSLGKIQFGLSNILNSNELSVKGNITINDNLWHYITITYSGTSSLSGIKIYVDNVLDTNNVISNTLTSSILNLAEFNIGARTNDASLTLLGYIDEFALFNRSLTAEEVSRFYSGSVATTNGWIKSNPIALTGFNWSLFNADYDNKDGGITFQILDEDDNVICNGLGDISICANNITPIKLFANLSRINTTLTSPEIDRWYVNMLTDEIQEIKGAGEINVNNWGGSGGTAEVNETKIAQAVWDYNGTINSNILNQIGNTIWTIFSVTNGFVNQIVEGVWTRTNRDLTYYPAGSNLSADDVWNNPTRTLTYYPTANISFDNASAIAEAVWNYNGTISDNLLDSLANKVACVVRNIFAELNGGQWAVQIC